MTQSFHVTFNLLSKTRELTIDYIIQSHQCKGRCRHRSIQVTNNRHESAMTRIYDDKGLQTRLRDSKICHVVSRGYVKRDYQTRLCQGFHETKRRARSLK